MEFLLRLLHGFLRIRMQGVQIERFVNLCRNKGIVLREMLMKGEECMECLISVTDFRKIQNIRRKTGIKIRIMKKCGMPFFFLHHKKRKAFFLGILCVFCTVWMLSGRVWTIKISGNLANSTPEIMKYLEEQGIVHGLKQEQVDCGMLAEKIRERYENVTWVSAKLARNALYINLKEGVMAEEVYEEQAPADLVANRKGKIVKMVTRAGVPQKKVDDLCEVGDILVKGQVEILNDNQEIIRKEYVCADADVFIQYRIPYYKEIPLHYWKEVETGEKSTGFSLKVGNVYFSIGNGKGKKNITEEVIRLKITESCFLPVWISKISAAEYENVEKIYTKEQAEKIALKELHKYEENLIQKGVQIFANNVTIKFSQNLCVCSGYLEVIENAGIQKPIVSQEQPIRKDIEE